MRDWLSGARRTLGRDDAGEAYEAERNEIRAALGRPAVDARIVAESARLLVRPSPSTAILGHAVADPRVMIPFDLAALPANTHVLCLGASGSGKTRLLGLLCRQAIRSQLAGIPLGLYLHAPKDDFGDLVVELMVRELAELPAPAREQFFTRFSFVDPFRDGAPPVPLNILASIPGVPPQVQAYEVATSMSHVGEGMGPNQTTFLYNAILAAIGRITLPALYDLAGDPIRLAPFARSSPHSEVRDFFNAQRLSPRSVEGVRARLHSLLRVPAARRCLEAETCLSFGELLGNRVSVLCTGGAPLGCEDVGRSFNLMFASRMGRAIFARRDRGETPSLVFLDEFQDVISAGQYVAETAERLLNQARSRNVSLVLATQTLANVSRVSSTLPEIAVTNAGVVVAFRTSAADVRVIAEALPATGRRLQAAPPPWEPRERVAYMTPDEERRALLAEASSLAPRLFWFLNRAVSGAAVLVRTADIETTSEDALRAEALLLGDGARSTRTERVRAPGATVDQVAAGLFRVRPSEEPRAGGFRIVGRRVPPSAPTGRAVDENCGDGEGRNAQGRPRGRGRGRPRRRGT